GGFARAVGTDQPQHLAGLHREGEPSHHRAAAVDLLQSPRLDHGRLTPSGTAAPPPPPRRRPTRPGTTGRAHVRTPITPKSRRPRPPPAPPPSPPLCRPGGFARAVGPAQPQPLAGLPREGQPSRRRAAAVDLLRSPRPDHGRLAPCAAAAPPPPPRRRPTRPG